MRMSDEEYFRSCVAKERHLAQLLGHEVEEFYESAGVLWEGTTAMPQWTRDWAACGPLIALYNIPISYGSQGGDAMPDTVIAGSVIAHYSDHPSPDRALMYAIVKAVITLLEHDKAHRYPHRFPLHHHAHQAPSHR